MNRKCSKRFICDFIFYFIYSYSLFKDGPWVARISACLIVAIALRFHVALGYSILRFWLCYWKGISIARSNVQATRADDLRYLSLAIAAYIIAYFVFSTKRIDRVVERYQKNEKFYTVFNFVKFISAFLIPLLISIFFVNKSVGYCKFP